ncbi:MAG: DUF1553 domain-containing protein [Acidobacteria bacterium]|nr:DUF1553 domain-containing protein [Acidobacteriota bacterium]
MTLDLTGLPPTPAEVAAFLADTSPAAYEKVVDRLLASPRYGERMAYRWMEASRYGDTNGYQTDGPREMWRWRDWVIDAFNRNMPYDRFTVEQLAGDLLPGATLPQRIATGFNRNHRTNGEGGIIPEEYRVEYVADRTQTTATVFLGLTLGCARCHDHKYDPLPQKDFYRLFAYFNIPNEQGFSYNYGNEEPYIKAPLQEQQAKLAELDGQVERLAGACKAFEASLMKAQRKWERSASKLPVWTVSRTLHFRSTPDMGDAGFPREDSPAGQGWHFDGKRFIELKTPAAVFGQLEPFTFSAWVKPETLKGGIFSQQDDYYEGTGHGLYVINGKLRLNVVHRWTDLALRVETAAALKQNEWQHVLVSYDGKRKARGVRIYIDGQRQDLVTDFDQLAEPFKVSSAVPFRIGSAGGLRFRGSVADVRVYKSALDPEESAAVSPRESLAAIAGMPAAKRTAAQASKLALAFLELGAPGPIQAAGKALDTARREREKFYEAIPTVMVMAEAEKPRPTFLLKRGAYDAPADPVTPGVPLILPQPAPELPGNRLGLARWMVDRNNPLTARVMVNRFWQSFFGAGIVKTVDDFGSQGEWPVHPELLDWLATEFMDRGWDMKAIQKLMVMSATYRQSAKHREDLKEIDPENKLLARAPRYRFPAELIRDNALAASGLLNEQIGGPGVKPYQPEIWKEKAMNTVSNYGVYTRHTGENSPNREVCTVHEGRTNTPLQALDLMNDVAFQEASRKMAERMMVEGGGSAGERIAYAYRLLLARAPRARELEVLRRTFEDFRANFHRNPPAVREYLSHGEAPLRADLDPVELAAYTTVASLVLNLDAAVNKE